MAVTKQIFVAVVKLILISNERAVHISNVETIKEAVTVILFVTA